MSLYLSKKIKFFSFWLMIGVVVLHSTLQDNGSGSAIIQIFVSFNLMQVCVPMFFIISGYLFFLNIKSATFSVFVEKIKKRFKTLVLPYFIWSLLVFGLVYLLQYLPIIGNFFPQKFSDMNLKNIIMNAVILPYNYPLWFLRELIIYVLFTPLLYYFVRYGKIAFLILIFILSVVQDSFHCYIMIIHTFSFFCFALGGYLGLAKHKLIFPHKLLYLSGLIFIALNLFLFLFKMNDEQCFDYGIKFLYNVKNIAGSLFLWLLFDKIVKFNDNFFIKKYYNYSFPVFVMHGIPTIMLVRFFQQFIFNEYMGLLYYCLIPFVVIMFCICIAILLKRYFGKVYVILYGNR
jgi:surface polysaccharide O-acyltransferase-like enzyme